MSTKKEKKGISLRTLHAMLVLGATLLAALMLYSTFYLSASFRDLTEKNEMHIELQKAAVALMDASDYMTEKVQRFAVNGDIKFLYEYYDEAFLMQHREQAIDKMSQDEHVKDAYNKLQEAMKGSEDLMEKEYYAIKLVVQAKGYKNVPIPLGNVVITPTDEELSPEEKMDRAAQVVFDNDYYAQKHMIHSNMQASLDSLTEHINESDAQAIEEMRSRLTILRIVIVIATIVIFALVWFATRLGINPIIRAVDRIKNNSEIPESGSSEFRYLIRAYNRMYEMYRKSIDNLSFKASHDELTGVYNRTGFDSIVSSVDLNTTYIFLVDVDNFKTINDNYGHETGDKVLVKLSRVLKSNFRPDDFICRIGGDEFVIFMLHTDKENTRLITSKVESINRGLSETNDGLPATSISVGIIHGSESDKIGELYEKIDSAMYESKHKGKSTYTIYTSN